MEQLKSSRLLLKPMTRKEFNVFVETMLTDPRVVEHYRFYKRQSDLNLIRKQAEEDFWEYFEDSRNAGLEIWTVFDQLAESSPRWMYGWSGLLHTSLAKKYGGPELQYMIAGRAHGLGYATEAAATVLRDARERSLTSRVIATVDIPNTGSIRVLEKLNFELVGRIEAYGSTDMYLYAKSLDKKIPAVAGIQG